MVTSGSAHTCGMRDDGGLWCWGFNAYGQLGLGDMAQREAPEQVDPGESWAMVSAGLHHTCGIQGDDTLWCWGRNFVGQLGLGDTDQRESPAEVSQGTDWILVVSGSFHTCGTREPGSLWCWGYNETGQLGLGDADDRHSPEEVGTESDWWEVRAGAAHTCGTRTDGSLWCWGANAKGQLGQGDTAGRDVPVQVGTTADWATVSTGLRHTCGIRLDGTLWCWGENTHGQLGFADDVSRDIPADVGLLCRFPGDGYFAGDGEIVTTYRWSCSDYLCPSEERACSRGVLSPGEYRYGGECTVVAACNECDPGGRCADGTIYAGSYNGFDYYTTPADLGQYTWGSFIDTGTHDQDDGWGNTEALAALEAAGQGTFPAALVCWRLDAHGHTDWFLPASNELRHVLYENRHAIGGFGTSRYWSSSSHTSLPDRAYYVAFTSGQVSYGGFNKSNTLHVRCARGSVGP